MTGDPIDLLIQDLSRLLPGRSRLRADMLREIRAEVDGARERYRQAGLSEADAALHAVEEFGEIDGTAVDLQIEIAARSARRTACLLGAGYPLMLALWTVNGAVSPAMTGTSAPPWVTGSFSLVSHLMFGVGSLLVLALVRTARTRRGLLRVIRLQISAIGIAAGATLLAVVLESALSDLHGTSYPLEWLNDVAEYFSGAFIVATLVAGVVLLQQRRRLLPDLAPDGDLTNRTLRSSS